MLAQPVIGCLKSKEEESMDLAWVACATWHAHVESYSMPYSCVESRDLALSTRAMTQPSQVCLFEIYINPSYPFVFRGGFYLGFGLRFYDRFR